MFQLSQKLQTQRHLAKHNLTHQKPANNYSCNECNKAFPTFEIASTHVKHAHGKPVTSSSTGASFTLPCNLCENTFQDQDLLLQHLKAYHGVSNPENRFMGGQGGDGQMQSSPPRSLIIKITTF